jgi:hypothetical protein
MKKIILIVILCCWMKLPVHAQAPIESTDIEGKRWLFASNNSYDYGNMWLAFSSGSIYRIHGNSEGAFRICNEMDYALYFNMGPITFYKYTEIGIGDWIRTGTGANFVGMLLPMLGMGFEWHLVGPNIPIIPKILLFYSTLEIEEIQHWIPEQECDEIHGTFYDN